MASTTHEVSTSATSPLPSQTTTSAELTTTNNTSEVATIAEGQDPEQKKTKKIVRKKRRPARPQVDQAFKSEPPPQSKLSQLSLTKIANMRQPARSSIYGSISMYSPFQSEMLLFDSFEGGPEAIERINTFPKRTPREDAMYPRTQAIPEVTRSRVASSVCSLQRGFAQEEWSVNISIACPAFSTISTQMSTVLGIQRS